MVKNRKTTKTDVLEAALEILKRESLEDLTARRVAEQLDSSVQPIFYNFESMEELKTAAYQAIYNLYQYFMNEGAKAEEPYKGMGLAYIEFARTYPNYFKMIFMSQSNLDPNTIVDRDNMKNHIIDAGRHLTGFDFETQKEFHLKVWIFTHGLATLVATGTIEINDAEVERLLTEAVHAMVVGERVKQAKQNRETRKGFHRFRQKNGNYETE